jgi:nucleotide-binding universal stress UspA family protein
MFDRILVPTDGSDGATVAFDHALELAAAHDGMVHVINVADTARDSVTSIRGRVVDALEQEGARIVREATERATERGVPIVTEVLQGDPYRTIIDYAATHEIDLVVIPRRGQRGLAQALLGSTTERVVRRAEPPVLTVPPDGDVRHPYRTILVATDGSDPAATALSVGVDLAVADGASVDLLSVVEATIPGLDAQASEERVDGVLDAAATTASEAGVADVSTRRTAGESVAGSIREHAGNGDIDLVVVGTHGRSGIERYLLGSVAERLVRTASVPVLTVRPTATDA